MTARSLHNLPARNVLRVIKQNQKMNIVTCILQILGIPLVVGALMWMAIVGSQPEDSPIYKTFNEEGAVLYIVIGCCCLGVAVFMGLFAAICSFTELHNKPKVDMLYALPLTGDQRFFSDYLGGICMYIVPYCVSTILGWIIFLVMSFFINYEETSMTQGEFMGMAAKYYALATFGLLALMLLYYTLSVFVTVCCGTLFESIYTNVLLNVLIPGTMAAVIAVICNRLELDFAYIWQSIGYMSPIGGLIYLIFMLTSLEELFSIGSWNSFNATQTESHALMPSYLRWIVAILVVAVLLTLAAWKLYTRRKSEYVGKPFVYVCAYYLMLTLLTVAILCLCEVGIVGPIILFAAIVYFIMEVIRRRGFKKFWFSVVTFVATVALFFGMGALIVYTDGFGRVYYIPGTTAISSVRVEMDRYRSSGGSVSVSLEYTDKDVIRAVTEFHKAVNDRMKDDIDAVDAVDQSLTDQRMVGIRYNESTDLGGFYMPSYKLYSTIPDEEDAEVYEDDYDSFYNGGGYDWYDEMDTEYPVTEEANKKIEFPEGAVGYYGSKRTVSITYYTVTGSCVHRRLYVNSDELVQLSDIVQDTPLYAEAMETGLWNRLYSSYSDYDQDTHITDIPDTVKLGMRFGNAAHYCSLSGAKEKLEQLTSVYHQDIENMTTEDFHTTAVYGYIENVPVYETCTETIALLEEWGLQPFNVPEKYDFNDMENATYDDLGETTIGVRIYEPGTWTTASLQYPYSLIDNGFVKQDAEGTPAYEDIYHFTKTKAMRVRYPELHQLLDAAQESYIANEECYLVVVNNSKFVVPPEHSDLAEALIAKGSFSALGEAWMADLELD